MATKLHKHSKKDSYLDLVRAFPLAHIRDDAHLDQAANVIDGLLMQRLDKGGQEYLDALTDLVELYEDRHVPIPDVSESDVLEELMRTSGLSQHTLAKKVGIAQSTLSAVLSGARTLTKEQIITLARHFGISPGAFFPA